MKKKLPRHEVIERQAAAIEAATRVLEGSELEQVSGGFGPFFNPIMIYGVPIRPGFIE